jgi:hypothetical protein
MSSLEKDLFKKHKLMPLDSLREGGGDDASG